VGIGLDRGTGGPDPGPTALPAGAPHRQRFSVSEHVFVVRHLVIKWLSFFRMDEPQPHATEPAWIDSLWVSNHS